MHLREDAQWSLVIPTSMGVRISPAAGQPVHVANQFMLQVTSAESNVGSISSHLGQPVKILTNFVAGSPIAQLIKSDLAGRHMAYEGPEVPQGGAWGYRHQFNIADSGYGNRGARVWNDRAGEVGRTLSAEDFDLDRIFGDEGVRIVHMSGLIAALSPETCRFCLEVARAARRHGTAVSFDLNHRASFWEGREAELREAFTEIAELCTVLVGNEEDFQLALGLQGPEAGGRGLECTCTSLQRRRYFSRLSGPLLDRVDIQVEVGAVSAADLASTGHGESSAVVARRVLRARRAAERRLAGTPWHLNAEVPGSYLRGPDGGLSAPLSRRLMTALERGDLSLRGVDRVLRLAWSLADLEEADTLALTHIGTALALRTSGVRP